MIVLCGLLGLAASCASPAGRQLILWPAFVIEAEHLGRRFDDETLARTRASLGCPECESFQWEDAFGWSQRVIVGTEPYRVIDVEDEVRRVIVKERARITGDRGRFFTIELEMADALSRRTFGPRESAPPWLLAEYANRRIGVESTFYDSPYRLRIATVLTKDEATALASELGTVELEPLTDQEAEAMREHGLDSLVHALWHSHCAPDSPIGRAGAAEYEALIQLVPDLVERVDCSVEPRGPAPDRSP